MRGQQNRRRLWWVAASLAAVLVPALPAAAAGTGGRSARAVVVGVTRAFSAKSFWYQAVPAKAPVAAKSAVWVAELADQVQTYHDAVGLNIGDYAVPVYVASASQATVRVGLWNCQHKAHLDQALAVQFRSVPIPAGATPAAGTDHDLVIWQPSRQRMWEFWQMRQTAAGWQACWGGLMSKTNKNIGRFGLPFGTSATGLALMGGLITPAELERGVIKHVIALEIPEVRAGIVSWPAMRGDGTVHDANSIAEGQRFRLSPTVDVATLPMSPMGKIIAQAMQTYGVVVTDQAEDVALEAQSPASAAGASAVNPYTALLGSQTAYQVLDGFPWSDMEALPFNYGKNAAVGGGQVLSTVHS